jgi:hypothetical protein
LQAGWVNIELLLPCVLQTTFGVPQYTNRQTDSRTGGLNIEYVLHITCNIYRGLSGWQAQNIHFLDCGFSGWRAQNWVYIVLCATRQHSDLHDIQIEKRIYRLADSTLHFYWSVSSKQHSEFRDIQIDIRTPQLEGSRMNMYYTLNVICNTYYM